MGRDWRVGTVVLSDGTEQRVRRLFETLLTHSGKPQTLVSEWIVRIDFERAFKRAFGLLPASLIPVCRSQIGHASQRVWMLRT